MDCPSCKSQAFVQETKSDGVQTIRAYRCTCGYRFYTHELVMNSETGGKLMYAIKRKRTR